MSLSGNRKDFVATIGDDPADGTNVSQWQLIFRGHVTAGHHDGQSEYPAREQVDDLEQHPAS
jgi:hypothetical protein